MEYKRADRVAGLIKQEISDIVRNEVQDPRVSAATITEVKITDDLRYAKVYFVCASDKQKSTQEGFSHSKGFIKKMLASRLKLRYMPDIVFYYDDSFDYSSNIESLLKKVKVEAGDEG